MLLQVATPTPPPPNYTPQLEAIVKALSRHELIPGWLLGAIAGFVLAMLAEPVKAWIQRRIAIRRVEHILIDAVESVALSLSMYSAIQLPSFTGLVANFPMDKFDYIYENERAAFYAADKSGSLRHFFNAFIQANETQRPTDHGEQVMLIMHCALLKDRIEDGLFSRRFVRALSSRRMMHLCNMAARHKLPSSK